MSFQSPNANEFIGGGTSSVFAPPWSIVSFAASSPRYIQLRAGHFTDGQWQTNIELLAEPAAIDGTFRPGTYKIVGWGNPSAQPSGTVGMILGMGNGNSLRGCGQTAGTFTITSLTSDSSGDLTSLDANLDAYCAEFVNREDFTAHLQLNAPTDISLTGGQAAMQLGLPQAFDIAVDPLGSRVATGTVDLLDGSTHLGTVQLDDSGQAEVALSLPVGSHFLTAKYSGDPLHPAAESQTWVGEVLDPANFSEFSFVSQPGDYIGNGETWDDTDPPTNVDLVYGDNSGINMIDYGTQWWDFDIIYDGGPLQVGTTYPAAGFGDPVPPGGLSLNVTGNGRGCDVTQGSVTVNAIATDPLGNMIWSDVGFTQSCVLGVYGVQPSMTGFYHYNVPPLGRSSLVLSAPDSQISYGNPVTLTATLSLQYPTSSPAVVFMDGATTLGSATPDANGVASLIIPSLSRGIHNITATYAGDQQNTAGSSTPFTINVPKIPTQTTVKLSLPVGASAAPMPFVVTANSSGTAVSGHVALYADNRWLTAGTLSNGSAVLYGSLPPGSHTVIAVYLGNPTYAVSVSSPVSVSVPV